MRHPRLGMVEILVRDVSEQGIGGKCASGIEPGDQVVIYLADCPPAAGTIAWRNGQAFGVRLDGAIDPAVVKSPPSQDTPMVKHEVPEPFRPTVDTKRPGFGRWRTGPKTDSDCI